ncbi:translation initiation factor IF-2 [Zavarzinia compransoris]|uniref:Translation initiation factor IF-2 n=1 Tax=Zavarzinia compransoris TaxID=1264899 RepID=A0A317E1F8_9PROT|nr:translation initiation factor IF-2 [Zavarzinia compransoris]PWR20898.1 translation initiation factor IF-2 [Zavarzinia compransoris]TDP44264.1 translation initiation factor IF-2 [Zavarzinia compransoris]
MSDVKDNDDKKLSLGGSRTLQMKKPAGDAPGQVRQSFSHGRSKPVVVEHKRKRMVEPGHPAPAAAVAPAPARPATPPASPQAPAAQTSAVQTSAVQASAAPAPVVQAPVVQAPAAPAPAAQGPAAQTPAPAPAAAEPAPGPAADPRPARADAGLPRIIEATAPVVRPKILGEAPVRRPEAAPAAAPVVPAQPAQGPRMSPNQGAPAQVNRPGQPPRGGQGQGQQQQNRNAPQGQRPNPQAQTKGRVVLRSLSDEEKANRARALEGARVAEERARQIAEIEAKRRLIEEARQAEERAAAERRKAEEDARRKADDDARRKAEAEAARRLEQESATQRPAASAAAPAATTEAAGAEERRPARPGGLPRVLDEEERPRPKKPGAPVKAAPKAPVAKPGRTDDKRRSGKVNVSAAIEGEERQRSVASMRRRIEREKRQMRGQEEKLKVVRDVIVPEVITVQELANRMAERGADVIKQLMRLGVMATINQSIDADTAELVVTEFGHRFKRVAESDVEIGLEGEVDTDEALEPRAPVVTVMGHVDHGKTSLLDALRSTDVAAGEAGGITQHIGAYQVTLSSGQKITFLDTPGHEAFTAMRARGAKVTDIVVLVVAADDGIMPQTVEAIRHARAAGVPVVVAINKIDKADANPNKVRQALLQHEIVVEDLGGDVQAIEVSAKARIGLDKLEEAILLQAEILELRANPNREAAGVVIEAKLDRGRGPVATVLVQKGTLKVGDIFVAGSEWGKVRALLNDRGDQQQEAGPAVPVEVLGLTGTPSAGDDFQVVDSEARAREVTAFRQRRTKEQRAVGTARVSLEQMFSKIKEGQAKELPVVIKADVQGSLEAIVGSLSKLGNDEVAVRILHDAVGGITESDVTLAKASNAPIIAFNVRANKQAREMADHEGVEIRYYSIIYDLVDDVKAALSGLLAPTLKETFLGYASIRETFQITKSGKVAGCLITDGVVKRGAKVRIIRDNVVIHEGTLSSLRRFKDEVKEVKATYECGMAFDNYENFHVGDVVECFDIEEIARTL